MSSKIEKKRNFLKDHVKNAIFIKGSQKRHKFDQRVSENKMQISLKDYGKKGRWKLKNVIKYCRKMQVLYVIKNQILAAIFNFFQIIRPIWIENVLHKKLYSKELNCLF